MFIFVEDDKNESRFKKCTFCWQMRQSSLQQSHVSCKAANKPAPLHSVQKLICHKLQVKSFHFLYAEHFSASFFTVLMSQQPQEQLVLWVVGAFSTDAWMGRVDALWAVKFIQSFVPENDAFVVERVLSLFASLGWKCFWELVWIQEEHFQYSIVTYLSFTPTFEKHAHF